MSLVDRLLRRPAHGAAAGTWDDEGVESVVELATALATAWDAEPGDPRASASRAVVLGSSALVLAADVEARGVAGRPLPPAGPAPGIRRGGRRPALALVAAGLVLAVSLGTVAASAPGGILYEARVGAEGLFLPGTPDDRAGAQVARLDARLAEASGAAARGDTAAAAQALRAYARIASEAAADLPADAAVAVGLTRRVQAQLVILAALGTGHAALEDSRATAMVAARALLGALTWPDGSPGPGPAPGPIGSPRPSPATPQPTGRGTAPSTPPGNGGPGSSAGPGGSPAPGATGGPGGPAGPNGPAASPRPDATTAPAPSSGPTARPTPHATPKASGGPSSPGGGSGPGSPGDGGGETPRPSGGGGGGGGDAGAISEPGGRP